MFGKNIPMPFLCKEAWDSGQLYPAFLKNSLYKKNPAELFVNLYSSRYNNSIIDSIKMLLADVDENGARKYHREFDYFSFFSAFNQCDYLHALHNRAFIEERTVALDNDVFDLYLEIPNKFRIGGKIFKKAMKKLDFSIASIPNANTGLSPILPSVLEWVILIVKLKAESILRKVIPSRKNSVPSPVYTQGSWPNFAELIRYNEKLKKVIKDTIEDPECVNPSIFDIERIKGMFNEHLNREMVYKDFLFLLVTFGRWHKKYGPHKKPL